ncbi:hypothetical protein [Azospirillum sp. B510]|uniref:hypothetical protein n=1 Tax=Azospirillum sp. (strain B510) TaxID=137722 RepID=UPI0011D04957|nr:hypothetical protein [Azospirillum sp. B510]
MSHKLTAEQIERYDGFDCRPASDPQNPIKIPQYLQDLIAKKKAEAAALASSQASDANSAIQKSNVTSTVAVEINREAYDVSLSSAPSRQFNDFMVKLVAAKEERKKNRRKRRSRLEYLKAKAINFSALKSSSGEPGEDLSHAMLPKGVVKSGVSLVAGGARNKNKDIERKYNNMRVKNLQNVLRAWMNKQVHWSHVITDHAEVRLVNEKESPESERNEVKSVENGR